MWKWIRRLAVLYIIWEVFLSPGTGLIQTHAQSACTIAGNPGGQLGTQGTSLGTMTNEQVEIEGGCIDSTPIGQNTPAAGSFTTETTTGNQTATGALNTFGTSTSAPAHIGSAQTTAPVPTSCGTGSPSVAGSDTAGIITMGTSATGCIVTFNRAYTGTPICSVDWQTNLASMVFTVSPSAITLTQTSASGNLVDYFCVAPAGG